jgi:hypothetical protein
MAKRELDKWEKMGFIPDEEQSKNESDKWEKMGFIEDKPHQESQQDHDGWGSKLLKSTQTGLLPDALPGLGRLAKRGGQDVVAGLGGMGRGLVNAPANIFDFLATKGVVDPSLFGRVPKPL